MTYQRNEIPEPFAGEPFQDQPLPPPGAWIKVSDRLPPYDEHMRILAYTSGVDFGGEQFFDIPALDLYATGEDMTEVAEHVTDWCVQPSPDAMHDDDRAVDQFAAMMKDKLRASRLKGRAGWQLCSADRLSAMLRDHVEKGDPVDVANLAMMLTLIGSAILPDAAANDPTPTADDLAALERKHFGDPDKGTGIYSPRVLALPVRDAMNKPGCTCETCAPMGNPFDGTATNIRMILCETCGNKRCPHATDHRLACTNSNEPGQPGSSHPKPRAPRFASVSCSSCGAQFGPGDEGFSRCEDHANMRALP